MKQVSIEVRNAIATGVSKSLAGQRAMGKAVDALQADGVTVEMLTAPKKDQDRAFYDSVCAAVVAGFTATVQDLLTKETKTLSDEKKGEKRYWQQQIGSKVKDLRNMLQRRLDSEDEGGAGSTSTLESRIKRDLTKYIAQLEKVEAFKGNVVELIKCLKSGLVYVK
jgi:hypothetical protein